MFYKSDLSSNELQQVLLSVSLCRFGAEPSAFFESFLGGYLSWSYKTATLNNELLYCNIGTPIKQDAEKKRSTFSISNVDLRWEQKQ